MPLPRLSVTLDQAQVDALLRIARERRLPVSALVRLAVADFLAAPVINLDDARPYRVQAS